MNQRALRTLMDVTTVIMLTIACLPTLHNPGSISGNSVVESPVLPLINRAPATYALSAMADPMRTGARPASLRGHCASGCHAGVQPDHLHTH